MQINFQKINTFPLSFFLLAFFVLAHDSQAATGANPTINNTVHITQCGTLSQTNTRYILDNDMRSDGTCLQVTVDSVEIDLGGHTITYDDAAGVGVPNADFEVATGGLPDNWTLTGTTAAQIKSTTDKPLVNSYYLDMGNSPDGTVLESGWSTLPANTTASIYQVRGDQNWWVYTDPEPVFKFEVEFQDGSIVYSSQGTGITNGFATFTTENIVGQYKVRMTVLNGNGYVASYADTFPWVDLFDVRTAENYGIELVDFASGTQINIHNGNIVQGAGKGLRSHAVYSNSVSDVTIDGISFDTSGIESSVFFASYSTNVIIRNSTVVGARTPWIFNRMQILSAMSLGNAHDVQVVDNVMDCGVKGAAGWGCINFSGSNAEIARNTLTAHTNVTNHHAIVGYAVSNTSVHDNVIESDPGQGILISANSTDFDVYNNTITLKSVAPNVEYGLIEHDAITIKDYASNACRNAKVHNNTITLLGQYDHRYSATYLLDSKGYMDGIMQMCGGGNALYYDNDITARIIDSGMLVNGIELGGLGNNEVVIYRNRIESDWSNVLFGGYAGQGNAYSNLKIISNTFVKGANPAMGADASAAASYHTIGQLRAGQITTDQTRFIDNKVENGASLLDASTGVNGAYVFKYDVDWFLDVVVKDVGGNPVPGAVVSVKNKNDLEVFSGSTDAEGKIKRIVVAEYNNKLKQQWQRLTEKTDYNPYTVIITPPSASPVSQQVTMDKSKTVTLQAGAMTFSDNVGTYPGDVDSVPAPSIFGGLPSGRVKWDTTTVNMQVSTTKDAVCKYDVAAGKPYDLMAYAFAATGTTAHATDITNTQSGQVYAFYVKCRDAYGNVTMGDVAINFSINNPPDLTIPDAPIITPQGVEPMLYSKLDSASDLSNPTNGVQAITSTTDNTGTLTYGPGVDGNALTFGATNPTTAAAFITVGKNNIDFTDVDDNGGVLEFWLKLNFDPHQFTGEKFLGSGFSYGASTSTFMIEWYGSNPYLVFEFDKNIQTSSTNSRFLVYSSAWNIWQSWEQDEWHKVTIFWKKNAGTNNAEMHMFIDGTQEGCAPTNCNDYGGTLPATTGQGLYAGIFGSYQAKFALDELKAFDSYSTLPPLSAGSPAPDTTPPSVPTNLRTTSVTQQAVQLAWNAATDNNTVYGYRVYRDGVQIGSTQGLSYYDSGLTAGATYTYSVLAYDVANNQSALSQDKMVTTLAVGAGGNCSDGIQNQNETGVDCGGVCGGSCGSQNVTSTDGLNIPNPKLFVGTTRKSFSQYLKSAKVTLKGRNIQIANGKVVIENRGKNIGEAAVDIQGNWQIKIKVDKFAVHYYDQSGTEVYQKSYKLKVDDKRPKFVDLPLALTKRKGQLLWWKAKDNKDISHYLLYDGNKKYKLKKAHFIIPTTWKTGLHLVKIKAVDKAGNGSVRGVVVRVF